MCRVRKTRSICFGWIFVWLLSVPSLRARTAQEPSTQELVHQLGDRDERQVMAAAQALITRGREVVPSLVQALDTRPACQIQFVASGVLGRVEPDHEHVETALVKLARGECSGDSQEDFVLKQQSAFALSYTASGIDALVDMVGHGDLRTRRRVAFAFEDLTEKLDSPVEEFRPDAALAHPLARALPHLAPFLAHRDEVLRCVTLEAMEQAIASRHQSVAAAAESTVAGKEVNCPR